jgi:hypothetical protein
MKDRYLKCSVCKRRSDKDCEHDCNYECIYDDISKELFGKDYDHFNMTLFQKARVRRVHCERLRYMDIK